MKQATFAKNRFQFVILLCIAIGTSVAFAKASKKNTTVEDDLNLTRPDAVNDGKRALKVESFVAQTEGRAMKQLDALLAKHRGTPMEAGLWMRKAELFMRKSKSSRFFELYREDQEVKRGSKDNFTKKDISDAIATYDLIQSRFPDFRDMDLVIFNNAFARQQVGDEKKSQALYELLISQHSKSPLVPDAYLAVGEMLFERKQFRDALYNFQQIRNFPYARVYPYGLYKSAWTRYNMRDTQAALKDLEEVVAYSQQMEKFKSGLDLRKEALNDMVLFYSEANEPSKAFAYFLKEGGETEVGPLLVRLTKLYEHHSRYKELEQVLKDYISMRPNSVDRPQAERDLIQNFEVLKDRAKAVAQLNTFREVCAIGSTWSKANPILKGPKAIGNYHAACYPILKESIVKLAAKWHRMWLKDKHQPELAAVSAKAYQIYLDVVPEKSDDMAATRYSYAELLFQTKDYRAASDQYALVARSTQDPKILHSASYGALVAFEKSVNDKWNDADEAHFKTLAQFYLTRNAKPQFATNIRFKRAFIAYEKSHYSEAAPDFKYLGLNDKSDLGRKSQDLYLDILNHEKQYDQIVAFTTDILKDEKSDERLKTLKKIHHQSAFARVQQAEEKGREVEAMNGYKAFALENRDSALSDKAWWNYIQLLYKRNEWGKAAEASSKLYEMYPRSEYVVAALTKSAQTYESILKLGLAADALENLAKVDSKNELKWWGLAGDFRVLDGDFEKARALYLRLKGTKDPQIVSASLEKLELIEKSRGVERESYRSLMKEMLNSPSSAQRAYAQLKIAQNLFERDQWSEAFQQSKTVLSIGDKSAAATMASARIIQARILEKEFKEQSVKSRPDRLAFVLSIKTEKLEKAQKAFEDVVRYGDPKNSVDALRELASCYENYASSLRGIKIQGDENSPEAQAFHAELEKLAVPMEEKQIETLAQALSQAKRFQLRDGTIGDLQSEINRLNMKTENAAKLDVKIPDAFLPKYVGVLNETK